MHDFFSKNLIFAAMTIAAATIGFVSPAKAANLGDSQIFTKIPTPPGYPEGIAVSNDKVYVCGPAVLGNLQSSQVLSYDLNGNFLQSYGVQNQNFSQQHALAGCAFNEQDLLYVVDTQQGIIRYDVDLPQAAEQVYASALPDLPTCSVVPAGTACSPTAIDRPPLPNDIRFDKKGYAYLSDSFQATIWRIPPGGGQPEIWYQDPQLDADFGPNGIGIQDDTNELYFASTFGSFGQGFIYKLPLVDKPTTNDLKLFYQYNPGDGPDGITFGASGNLYVALAGANQISVLNPDGTESARYSGPAIDPNNPNQSIPWTNPANIAFNDKTRSLLVTNHASLVPNPEPLFSVYTVYVDDEAVKTPEPSMLGAIFITGLLGWGYRRKFQHKN